MESQGTSRTLYFREPGPCRPGVFGAPEGTALPEDFSLLTITLPNGQEDTTYSIADLPKGWNDYPYKTSVQVGKEWLKEGKTMLLKVPSTIIRQEYNVLLNPLHPAFLEVRLRSIEPFGFDARLLK